jgi:hypothetical protein
MTKTNIEFYRCGHKVHSPIYFRGNNRKCYLAQTDCPECALQAVIKYSRSLTARSPITKKPYSLGELALRFIQITKRARISMRLRAEAC